MICDNCGKNEASIYFIKIFNNSYVKKMNLCKDCAKSISALSDEDFFNDLTKILSSIFEIDIKFYEDDKNKKLFDSTIWDKNKRCHYCNIDLQTIKKIGEVGCARCYDEFKDDLYPMIKSIHGSLQHKGKIPVNCNKRLRIEKDIKDLKYRLGEEVTVENFEEAAQLRDEIRKLQKKLYIN